MIKNPQFYTLASQRLKKPLTKFNMLSIDIPYLRLEIRKKPKDYHLFFKEKTDLEVIKDYCKHEYMITTVDINDIDYFCSSMKYDEKGILFIEKSYCNISDMNTIIETKAYDFDDCYLTNCKLCLGFNKNGDRHLKIL